MAEINEKTVFKAVKLTLILVSIICYIIDYHLTRNPQVNDILFTYIRYKKDPEQASIGYTFFVLVNIFLLSVVVLQTRIELGKRLYENEQDCFSKLRKALMVNSVQPEENQENEAKSWLLKIGVARLFAIITVLGLLGLIIASLDPALVHIRDASLFAYNILFVICPLMIILNHDSMKKSLLSKLSFVKNLPIFRWNSSTPEIAVMS